MKRVKDSDERLVDVKVIFKNGDERELTLDYFPNEINDIMGYIEYHYLMERIDKVIVKTGGQYWETIYENGHQITDSRKIKDADETPDVLDGILMIAFNDGSEEEGYNEVKKHANEQGELDGVQYETYDTDIQDGVTLIDLCAATDDANAFVKALLTEWGIIDAVADIEFEKSELMENAEVSDSKKVSDMAIKNSKGINRRRNEINEKNSVSNKNKENQKLLVEQVTNLLGDLKSMYNNEMFNDIETFQDLENGLQKSIRKFEKSQNYGSWVNADMANREGIKIFGNENKGANVVNICFVKNEEKDTLPLLVDIWILLRENDKWYQTTKEGIEKFVNDVFALDIADEVTIDFDSFRLNTENFVASFNTFLNKEFPDEVADSYRIGDMTKPAHLRGYAEKYRKKRREQKESYKENDEEKQDKEVTDSITKNNKTMRRVKDDANDTILHFHIGRGGSFHNQGYLTYDGVYNQGLTSFAFEHGASESDGYLIDEAGNYLGDAKENDMVGILDWDGDYDTDIFIYLTDVEYKDRYYDAIMNCSDYIESEVVEYVGELFVNNEVDTYYMGILPSTDEDDYEEKMDEIIEDASSDIKNQDIKDYISDYFRILQM